VHLSPEAAERIRNDFNALVNLEPAELKAWLTTPESRRVGMIRRGETESAGRKSTRKILAIRAIPVGDLAEADYAHMKKVIGLLPPASRSAAPGLEDGGRRHQRRLALESAELGPRSAARMEQPFKLTSSRGWSRRSRDTERSGKSPHPALLGGRDKPGPDDQWGV